MPIFDEDATSVAATRTHQSPAAPRAEGAALASVSHLLVIEGGTTRLQPLPETGEVLIGRSPDCGLALVDSSVSRRHARLRLDSGGIDLVDLGSHNGTRVNGVALEPEVAAGLLHGDVIAIGDFLLILHRRAAAAPVSFLLPFPALRLRADEELARAARGGRSLVLLHLRGDGPPDGAVLEAHLGAVLRKGDAGACAEGALWLLLPERPLDSGEVAGAVLGALAPRWPGLRGGLAVCPQDGTELDVLLAGARAAAAQAAPGAVATLLQTVTTLTAGPHRLTLAEPAVLRLYDLLERLARGELPVLLLGETGTGKEVAAHYLHERSARAAGPFVSLNCAAIPESLFESELFGHERGAFSGADRARRGYLEQAHGGTLFLDEIGELPAAVQAKLLRVLEARRYARLGETREREADVRLVAATNRDLEVAVSEGRFRQDLYFRLAGARIQLPPLRERRRELPLLCRALLDAACASRPGPPLTLSAAAMGQLLAHPWPGNIRELRNAMDYLASTAAGPEVWPWDLPETIAPGPPPPEGERPDDGAAPESEPELDAAATALFRPIDEEVRELERTRMLQALRMSGGVHHRAAGLIGMPKRTFSTKFRLYELGREPLGEGERDRPRR